MKKLLIALGLALPLAMSAAEPVAVWDGDFTATQEGYTLNLNGNSLSDDNSVVTIDQQSAGIDINFDSDMSASGVTLLVKYSNFVYGEKTKIIATQCSGGENYSNDRTGVDLQADNTLWGMWYNSGWSDNGTKSAAGVFPSSGCFAFTYKNDAGTYLYASSNPFSIPATSVWGAPGLKAGTDKLWGVTVGGMRSGTVNANWGAAEGAQISGIAVFQGVLTMEQVNEYRWPKDRVIEVSADTRVSAINTQIDADTSRVFIEVADGVQIDVDATFSAGYPIKVTSEGTVTLSATEQPDASYFSGVTFDVKGALLRTWLTPGVVGFNFYKSKGNVTTDALATGTWFSNASDKAGTSTDLFSDGLSVLSWNCATLYSQGGWNDQTGEEGSLLNGYLDDGSLNGNGAEVYLTNVPYETYDVIIYAASDTNPGNFLAKTVNGVTNTWDSTTGSVVEGNTTWGKAALNIPVYGVNTLRIKNLTGALTIYGTARSGSSRGGISAIQIMPPETPDNIRTYTLTLNGTATTWSAGTWTLDGNTVDAPTSGQVQIVATASTALTMDAEVSLADLKVSGGENVVVNVSNGAGGSLYAIKATIESGVFQQGSEAVLGATPTIVVESGAMFNINGLDANRANLTSQGGAIVDAPILFDDGSFVLAESASVEVLAGTFTAKATTTFTLVGKTVSDDNQDGTFVFSSIDTVLAAAQPGETVVLGNSITGNVVLPAGVKLDVGEYTLTGTVSTVDGYVVSFKDNVYSSIANEENAASTWVGADGASWNSYSSWSTGAVPGSNTAVTFPEGGTYTVSLSTSDDTERCASMTIDGNVTLQRGDDTWVCLNVVGDIDGEGTLTLNQACLRNTDGGTSDIYCGLVITGENDSAFLGSGWTIYGDVTVDGGYFKTQTPLTVSGNVMVKDGAKFETQSTITITGKTTFNGGTISRDTSYGNEALTFGDVTVEADTTITGAKPTAFAGTVTIPVGVTLTLPNSANVENATFATDTGYEVKPEVGESTTVYSVVEASTEYVVDLANPPEVVNGSFEIGEGKRTIKIGEKDVSDGFTFDTVAGVATFKQPNVTEPDEGEAIAFGDGTVTLNVDLVEGLAYGVAAEATLEALAAAAEPTLKEYTGANAAEILTVRWSEDAGFFKVYVGFPTPAAAEAAE